MNGVLGAKLNLDLDLKGMFKDFGCSDLLAGKVAYGDHVGTKRDGIMARGNWKLC